MGGEVSTDFKSSNRIEISRLVQVLLNFDWFWGSPILGVGGVGGWGWGWWQHPPHTCTHALTCTHMHAHARTYAIIGNSWDFPKSNGGSHLHGIIMFTTHACACVCVHACACMCTCVGAPPNHPPPPSTQPPQPPPTPIHPAPQPPPPPSTQPPIPRAAGSPKHQNSISLELIEIIQFCLKILYLWTFLNSYRL